MSEFGRHNSSRWAKAEVPLYGDEWDDEYVDEAPPNDMETIREDHVPEPLTAAAPVAPDAVAEPPDAAAAPPSPVAVLPSENLVLSIDHFRSRQDSDSSDDEYEFERTLPPQGGREPPPPPLAETPSHIMPPTPTFSNPHYAPETPQSDRSFVSDPDLIQRETPLHVGPVPRSDATPSAPSPPPVPLVLSIDREHDDDDWGYNSQNSSNDDETAAPRAETALDSLISDLQNNSLVEDRDLLPDHYDAMSSASERGEEARPTPTEPLALGPKTSVRKPPPDRKELVLVDYSSIADSVRGYMEDEDKTPIVEEPPDAKRGEDTFSLNRTESLGSLSTGKFSFAPSHLSNQMMDWRSAPAQPLAQSLVGSPAEFQPPRFDPELSRRELTVSTNTFSMGSWQPNTGSYRDQFINDNDAESRVSFHPSLHEKEMTANYNKFTRLGEVYEEPDNASSTLGVSIPDTIDATVPHDTLYHDLDASDSKEDVLHPVGTAVDSVLAEREHPAVFHELMTPKGSMLDVAERNDHAASVDTSNAASVDTSNAASVDTVVASEATRSASSGPVAGKTESKYPPYNWKEIMAKLQSIDRIALLREALELEAQYESGLRYWLSETLKVAENQPTIHIGKIATAVYQNAPHNDIRRHNSIRSKVSIVKDKVGESGLQASTLGKRFFSRGRKFIKSSE